MYCMSVEYPRVEGSKFDVDYYRNRHLPLCRDLLADHGYVGSMLRLDAGKAPGSGGLLWAAVDILFESQDKLKSALAAVGGQINADVPNYTDAKPRVSFAEVVLKLE
ncbi:MAG: EthD family reductase [Parahaliea sp.]